MSQDPQRAEVRDGDRTTALPRVQPGPEVPRAAGQVPATSGQGGRKQWVRDRAAATTTERPVAAAPSSTDSPAAAPMTGSGRRARLDLDRIDPWSVMKMSFLASVGLAVVVVVAVAVLWWAVHDSLATVADTIDTFQGSEQIVDVAGLLSFGRVMTVAVVVALVDVVLVTALATLGAFFYNVAAMVVGGITVTLSEES